MVFSGFQLYFNKVFGENKPMMKAYADIKDELSFDHDDYANPPHRRFLNWSQNTFGNFE